MLILEVHQQQVRLKLMVALLLLQARLMQHQQAKLMQHQLAKLTLHQQEKPTLLQQPKPTQVQLPKPTAPKQTQVLQNSPKKTIKKFKNKTTVS